MPGYGERMEKYTPDPTTEVKTVKSRFVVPKITFTQSVILVLILAYAWSVRKMNKAVISTGVLSIAVLHAYDHMYRLKREDERFFI
jgi:flagellar biogenesis protein FliO